MNPTPQPTPMAPSTEPMPAPQKDPVAPGKTNWLLAVIVAVIVIVAAAVGAWWWFNNDTTSSETAAAVTIKDSAFEPATIQIKKGQDVTWTNEGQAAHHIYADQSTTAGLDSQNPLNNGDTYTFTFENPGTYYYYDSLNPKLNATVVVE